MKKKKKLIRDSASFRDPSGFVYYEDNKVFRKVNEIYQEEYLKVKRSGLYKSLIDSKLLISFSESKIESNSDSIILKTDLVPFISYPYEWSFSQLKDAALLTLQIQQIALKFGFSLKDASAYNTQFFKGKPVFIDLLSFEEYKNGSPWVAYKQFCEHFLCPLLLMSKVDLSLIKLLRTNLNGIPLELTSKLLPKTSFLNPSIFSHIHLHAMNQKKYGDDVTKKVTNLKKLDKHLLLGIIENLNSLINGLSIKEITTEWGDYYSFTNYSDEAFKAKQSIVSSWLLKTKPSEVWDLGGNTGEFSILSSQKNIFTVSFDVDPLAIEKNYLSVKKRKDKFLLPLLMDLTNQSPGLGWNLSERKSLIERGPVDMAIALALIHHLCISNNVPFDYLFSYFANICEQLIIEFVPKSDSKVQKLLATRDDVFSEYTQENFEKSLKNYFNIVSAKKIEHGSQRVMYLLKKK